MKTVRPRVSRYGVPLLVAVTLAGCSQSGGLFGSPSAGVVSNPIRQDPNATIQPGQIIGGGTKQMAVDASGRKISASTGAVGAWRTGQGRSI
jgi:hypothetical protein